jgi:hypothetical protein
MLTSELDSGLISVEVMAGFGIPLVDTTVIADEIAMVRLLRSQSTTDEKQA